MDSRFDLFNARKQGPKELLERVHVATMAQNRTKDESALGRNAQDGGANHGVQ